MDTSGFSQVGRYGTLSLLKKRTSVAPLHGSPEPAQVVTSFGIDNANLTFGRASTCDVRLYYPSVDPVHCTLVHEDGKAFLAVRGKSGALVDGCWVYPHTSSSSLTTGGSEEPQQSIIPLSNNSEFEIHGKRFRFSYPPKEVRKVLLATPVAQRNRKLRLSMIQSAQVFSPRPSHDPRENLRILQSPIKASIFGGGGGGATTAERSRSQSPTKPRAVSPLKFGIRAPSESDDDDEEEGEIEEQDENQDARGRPGFLDESEEDDQIVLVHTNHPRVVEEERDLVILEDVPLHLILPSPSVYAPGSPVPHRPSVAQPQPQSYYAQPQTQQPPTTPPRRRSIGGNALHRAVLIRSAQRAVWKAEKEREEQEEEMEVLGAVIDPVEAEDVSDGDEDSGDEEHALEGRGIGQHYEDQDQELEDVEMRSASDEDEQVSTEEDDEEEYQKAQQKPLWRKSIEKIIPWPFGGKKEDDEHDDDEDSEDAEEENDRPAPLPARPFQQERLNATPARRTLGAFMTPQVHQHPKTTAATAAPPAAAGAGRYSLGGGEARRVIIEQPWKVKDLVVPPPSDAFSNLKPSAAPALRAMDPPSAMTAASLNLAPSGISAAPTIPGSATKPVVSEEERRAIQERRRSAARELKAREDTFWKDGAPGMMSSPIKSPAKAATGLGVGRPSFMTAGLTPSKKPLFGSPTKGSSLGYAIEESEAEKAAGEGDVEGDQLFLDDAARSRARAAGTPRRSSASANQDEDDESLDTNGLLERMKQTVESMKQQRRRSSAAHRVPATPKTLFGEAGSSSSSSVDSSSDSMPDSTPVRASVGSVKKIDFTKINTPDSAFPKPQIDATAVDPKKTIPGTPVPVTPPKAGASTAGDEAGTTEDEPKELEPFSLLRPGVPRPSLAALQMEKESEDKEEDAESDRSQAVPVVVVVDAADEEDDGVPAPVARATRGRGPRLLRAQKAKAQAEEMPEEDQHDPEEGREETHAKPPSSSKKPSSRTKPPSSSAKPRSRSTARSPSPEAALPTTLAAPESGPQKRQRSKTPQPRHVPEEVEEEPEPERPPTRSGTRRTRKGTAEPEEPPAATTPAPTTSKKRGRKAAADPEPEPVAEADEEAIADGEQVPVKRGRKPRSAVPVQEEEPAPTPAPAKRSRSRKAKEPEPTPVTVADDNEDEDELDSYQVPSDTAPASKTPVAGRSSSKKPEKEKPQSQIRPPSRTQQLKEKKAGSSTTKVKQEPDADENTDIEQRPATATRGRSTAVKTPASRTTTKTATTRTTTGTKTRGRSTKTAASGQAAATTASPSTDGSEEKENAPGASGAGSDEAKDEPVTKIRVSRRAGPAGATLAGSGKVTKSAGTGRTKAGSKSAAIKTEEEDEGPIAAATTGRTRTTRVMRTRTKTG